MPSNPQLTLGCLFTLSNTIMNIKFLFISQSGQIKKLNNEITDMKEKSARYISRNIELIQEFSFAHPKTKFNVNMIFNSHFSGQVLWDLFSREAEMIENTWNVSFRIMYQLPRNCHSQNLSISRKHL